jgi:Domain of unknown function (DUF4439)
MSSVLDEAWQRALAAEHAAVFGYGVLGPHTDHVELARHSEHEHRILRDSTITALVAARQTPVAPQVDYPLPFRVDSASSAAHLAVRIEEAAAAAWRYVIAVAASAGPQRDGLETAGRRALRVRAQAALTASAIRATRWRHLVTPATPTVPFPGI